MNREGKKCVLYPRVSTEMQVDGYSLEGQKNSLKRFADREEMEIVGIYEDAGKSGKSIEGRPAFKKMLSDIKNGLEIEYILVYKLSRFGRNAADILNSLEFVQSYGINLICIEEGIDSSQTSGKLLISVLSAVAEIERENIIEQTMNGRREKARQGGWNGGFAPYGYYLKDNQLLIEETEAEAIRIIFDKFGNSDIGLGGVAKYLNLQGIKKIPRQNGKLETWSSHLIRQILDNPVYCGKIAYGRRTREKVKGTKNEYKQVHTDDYILEDGQHEGIVSEELWQKVHAKRKATGVKQPSKVGKDRSHLLTGVLKCPICGSSMYTNKHAWTNKDGTYKEVYYYICGRNKQERGHHCDYKASLRKIDIEPLVVEAVKELVSDAYFAKEIEKRIGVQTDTSTVDKELANYENKLKEVDLNKARLENEIDNLPADARFRERKIHDMTLRLDALYDTMVELEERIEDAKLRKSSIEMEAITLDNVYKIMQNFGKLYAIMSDEEKKSLITYLIKEIQIYPNGESEMPLKSIEFNFPIYVDGRQVRKVLWERGNTVETVLHITEYYFTDDGKVNFIYCYEDTNYVPSYAKLSKKGVRYLFHNDTMVNWRIVNAEGEINYCYGKKEKKALSEHKKVVEYSKLSQEKRKQYDNCEKVMLNRAYNTFEKVNHFEGVSSICGYVCDENGTGMADASVTLKSTEYNCDVYGGTTNDKGYYNILVPTREAGYELAVTKEDFTEEEIYDVEIDEDKIDISQQPVYLSEKSDTEYSYALEFYDALSVSSLEGVSVTIRTGVNHRDGEPVSQFYSENSRENLSLVSGMYTVQISKEGYVDTYETIFVSGSSENLTQLYLSKQLNENELRIVLTWGETPNDLDSHLFTPGNMGQQDEDYHVAYYQKDLPDGSASLDVDEREGYGPETVTIDSVKEGQYKYYVADFSNCSSGNEDSYEMSRSHAAVRVYGKDGLIQTFYVPANRSGVLWEVFEIRDGTIVPLQRYYDVIGDKTWWSSGK